MFTHALTCDNCAGMMRDNNLILHATPEQLAECAAGIAAVEADGYVLMAYKDGRVVIAANASNARQIIGSLMTALKRCMADAPRKEREEYITRLTGAVMPEWVTEFEDSQRPDVN